LAVNSVPLRLEGQRTETKELDHIETVTDGCEYSAETLRTHGIERVSHCMRFDNRLIHGILFGQTTPEESNIAWLASSIMDD
jgi:hypothetical protein